MAARKNSSAEDRATLAELTGDELLAAAVQIMHRSHDLDVVRRAVAVLHDQSAYRDELTAKYVWCEEQPLRRDSGGYIRAAIVRAMRPMAQPDDAPLFHRAMLTYEIDGALELCADLRAAALLAMNEVDPELAANWAARLLQDPQPTMSGEPATTAIQLLASHGNLAPVFGLVSWGNARAEIIAEGLRSLTELPESLLSIIVITYIDNEDEQIILGLFDLILAHRSRDSWVSAIEAWFNTTTIMDLYGIIAIQIVASRSEELISLLRKLRANEVDPMRQQMLDQALALA